MAVNVLVNGELQRYDEASAWRLEGGALLLYNGHEEQLVAFAPGHWDSVSRLSAADEASAGG